MTLKPISTCDKDGIRVIEFSRKSVVDSDTCGNVVIDYDEDGNVVSLEILPFVLGKE